MAGVFKVSTASLLVIDFGREVLQSGVQHALQEPQGARLEGTTCHLSR